MQAIKHSFHQMERRLCRPMARRSKSGMPVRWRQTRLLMPKTDCLSARYLFSASLNGIGSTDAGSMVLSVKYSPDGSKIVSGLDSGTIKVWDSGAFWASNRPFLPKSDACWLVWQLRWISRLRNPTPTAAGSDRRRFPQTGRRSCQDRTIKRSKSGIRVRFGPQIAPSCPNLTPVGLFGSYAGSQDREDHNFLGTVDYNFCTIQPRRD